MTGNNLTNTNPNTTHTIEEFIEAGSVSSSVTYYDTSILDGNAGILYSINNVVFDYLDELKELRQLVKLNSSDYKKYRYDGKVFDSAPEVAFYIWLRDGGIKFVYQPYEKRITYYDQNGKQHIYQPDFYIIDTDQLIEIKGDQFFNNDGTMKNPYNSLYNESMELKHQCMIANNVKIMRNIDYQQYIKYVNYKYGKNFIKNLKYCK